MQYIVTIDGPAGSGKSTTAKQLARVLGLPYLNTGLIYRASGLRAEQVGLMDMPKTCVEYFEGSTVEIDESTDTVCLTINADSDYPAPFVFAIEGLRTPLASSAASKIGNVPGMGSVLVELQKSCAASEQFARGFVVEGRNTGTATFPQAFLKFYLEADIEVRRQRITELHGAANAEIIMERDERDGNRAEAPMKAAEDAIVIDNSQISRDKVVVDMFGYFARKLQALAESA